VAVGRRVRLADGMDRRSALALLVAGALAACGRSADAPHPDPEHEGDDVETLRYGTDPSQLVELTRPAGRAKGVVVVIHGGFWRSRYDLSLGRPLAASLAANGWVAVNIEYRRVGSGGGWPGTFDDVAAAIDALADVEGLDTSAVITLGHSAGGHLAVWAAGRTRLTGSPWGAPAVAVTAAISQAGVLDLAAASAAGLGGTAVQDFMGGGVDERYSLADPAAMIPLDVPVRCVHGADDDVVPLSQSADYVDRARQAGADAALTEVAGDHFVVIDPDSAAWSRTLKLLDELGP
jgi:acetyl esterase/lipase